MGAGQDKMPGKNGARGHTGPSWERELATAQLREHMIRQAINENSSDEMAQIVRYIDPDACLTSGESLLTFATKNGAVDAVRLLIGRGADVNRQDETGSRPLHAAIVAQERALIDALLAAGAKITEADATGLEPLHLAAMKGNEELVRRLLAQGANADSVTQNDDKSCALIIAATLGNKSCVEALLEKGANPDATDKWGFSSLAKATINGRPACVETLLRYKANIDNANRSAATPLQYAAIRDNCDVVALLTSHGADVAKYNADILPLAAAALNGCCRCARHLLEHGCQTEWTDRQNKTALFHALADVPKIDHLYKNYPLHAPDSRRACAELLLQHGADVAKVWRSKFWESRHRTLQQISLYKLAVRASGFKDTDLSTLRGMFHKVCMSGCADAVQLMCVAGYKPEGGAVKIASPQDGAATCLSCSQEGDQPAVHCNLLTEEHVNEWLRERSVAPPSLKHLSRLVVRAAIARNVIYFAQRLPVSQELKDYIIIKNYMQY